jgi:hypothetical protein
MNTFLFIGAYVKKIEINNGLTNMQAANLPQVKLICEELYVLLSCPICWFFIFHITKITKSIKRFLSLMFTSCFAHLVAINLMVPQR